MTVIYGVDTTHPLTPEKVRDAIITCFTEAHCQDSGIADSSLNAPYCRDLVKKMFLENSSDFDHPTKSDLTRLISSLINFSQNFRDPSIVTRHASEIQILLDLLPQD